MRCWEYCGDKGGVRTGAEENPVLSEHISMADFPQRAPEVPCL